MIRISRIRLMRPRLIFFVIVATLICVFNIGTIASAQMASYSGWNYAGLGSWWCTHGLCFNYTYTNGDQTIIYGACGNGSWYQQQWIDCQSSANICGQVGYGLHYEDYIGGYLYVDNGCNASTPGAAWAPATPDNGGQIMYAYTNQRVVYNNGDGTQRCINNYSGNTYFVPRNSTTEYWDFLNNASRLGIGVY